MPGTTRDISDVKLDELTLSDLAYMIAQDWVKVNFAAKPYLDAMKQLDQVTDNFYADSGDTVVRYFLSNASTYRGETAKALKAELKRRVGLK